MIVFLFLSKKNFLIKYRNGDPLSFTASKVEELCGSYRFWACEVSQRGANRDDLGRDGIEFPLTKTAPAKKRLDQNF